MSASTNNSTVRIRPANLEDVAGVTACVCAAYHRYIQRIGKQPGPMLEDYSKVIREHQVHVVERDRRILGALVLVDTNEGLLIDNVAVDPSSQGTGVGRLLLEFAETEARRRGLLSVYLSTNEKMTENQALYSRIGYVAFDHRVVNGYPRVFMRKQLT
jgi:GNAT superfamily N-acetyltransferase